MKVKATLYRVTRNETDMAPTTHEIKLKAVGLKPELEEFLKYISQYKLWNQKDIEETYYEEVYK